MAVDRLAPSPGTRGNSIWLRRALLCLEVRTETATRALGVWFLYGISAGAQALCSVAAGLSRAIARTGTCALDGSAMALHAAVRWICQPDQGRELVSDCEAFLQGRYLQRLPRRHRWEWAWVNTLAHGSREEIALLASVRHPRRCGVKAAAFGAAEVLSEQDSRGWSLRWLQESFLVPLELECMSSPSHTPTTTAVRLLEVLARAERAAAERSHAKP
ncbi:MAG: hypothetical protein ACRDVP_09590 [Acidimicrobiales bacterium]